MRRGVTGIEGEDQPRQNLGYLCWTRMQAEAGQSLQHIVARKECERRAGGGFFMWGVGTATAVAIRAINRLGLEVPVVFSTMRSKPRAADATPARVMIWRQYINKEGAVQPLPNHCLVTSRADSVSGPKRVHHALMCQAAAPLVLKSGVGFDHRAYRNVSGKGAPIGASQVTVLLQPNGVCEADALYEVNMKARLVASYWVRLVDPREISTSEQIAINDASANTPETWTRFVRELRRDRTQLSAPSVPNPMFV